MAMAQPLFFELGVGADCEESQVLKLEAVQHPDGSLWLDIGPIATYMMVGEGKTTKVTQWLSSWEPYFVEAFRRSNLDPVASWRPSRRRIQAQGAEQRSQWEVVDIICRDYHQMEAKGFLVWLSVLATKVFLRAQRPKAKSVLQAVLLLFLPREERDEYVELEDLPAGLAAECGEFDGQCCKHLRGAWASGSEVAAWTERPTLLVAGSADCRACGAVACLLAHFVSEIGRAHV